jgi:hypothetical protein
MEYEEFLKKHEKQLEKQKFWEQVFFERVYISYTQGWEWRWYTTDSLELPKEMPIELKKQARKEISELKKFLTKVRKEHKKTGQDPREIYECLRKEEVERNRPMTFIEQMRMLEQTFKSR